ncbi:Late embryogenesis abundant protein [Senna tora]|uniref:Late embryogenesis abundant protein n=1 Tax=Senna tora TaxID=362788 RepID=A0A834SXP3_9FABA|nr:Late embryogenesis abundant protein [Senna tora]
MSMLAKTDSEVSSLSQSSPARSPRRPVYYVQSPSRDSHEDGEKTTNSFHSSPLQSPLGSPPHSHSNSSLGPHSRESSSTRFSGSRKTSGSNRKSGWRPWKDNHFHAIEEEGLLDPHDASTHSLPRRCYFLAFILAFTLLFSSITFDQFVVQAGADFSGVATSMVSMNSSVKLTFRNTATFFGVHVTSTPLDLTYYQLTLASGNIEKFYQSRKSQRSMRVTVRGSGIPLYGGGSSLSSVNGAPVDGVPLSLRFMVRSRANVLGKLVKPKFYKKVECSVVMDSKKMNVAIPLKDKCTYED